MVRSYRRKSSRRPISSHLLELIKLQRSQGTPLREIAMQFDVNESTIRKRLRCGESSGTLGRYRRVFDDEQEKALVQHIIDMDNRFFGVSVMQMRQFVLQFVFQFAELNGIPHRFDKNSKMAGIDWTINFRERHDLSLRTPQKTSIDRIQGFNRTLVGLFFDNLLELQNKYAFTASQIFNMDESTIQTVSNKIPKVVSQKGKRAVGKAVSAERGVSVSIIVCFNALGLYVPPALIFGRKNKKETLMNGAPTGSLMFVSDSSYSNTDIFLQWLEHFKNTVHPSPTNPILLILDNHVSHMSLDAIYFCRENHIHLLTLPPHSSQKLQPLHRTFFGSLKLSFGRYSDQWIANNPGRVITEYQMAALFKSAYEDCATMNASVRGFEVTGIHPFNPQVFQDIDFLPSSVTDQPLDQSENNVDDPDPTPLPNLEPEPLRWSPDEMNGSLFELENVLPSTSANEPSSEPRKRNTIHICKRNSIRIR